MKHSPAFWSGSKKYWRKAIVLVLILSFLVPVISGCSRLSGFDRDLDTITGSYRFSLLSFEADAVLAHFGKLFTGPPDTVDDPVTLVKDYFSGGERDEDTRKMVEEIIEDQVRKAYADFGILNPWDDIISQEFTFPPVNIYLGKPPTLLVVSPRDQITRYREVMLLPHLTDEQKEQIEAEVTDLGYSAVVVGLGGVATYPSFVADTMSLKSVLNTAAEEWVHQYLAFTPLGFDYVLYLLKLNRDYEIAKLNETVAGIVSREIGNYIYDKYYAGKNSGAIAASPAPAPNPFDFNAAMRETRKQVDALLAEGKVDEAERYMVERRQYILENGYYIRKLNQAYFAFHGTYAAGGASVDPIGDQMRSLRSSSEDLEAFLDTASGIQSRDELQALLRE